MFIPLSAAVALTLLAGTAAIRGQQRCPEELLPFAQRGPSDALPRGWAVRAVRGHSAPRTRIVDSGGTRFLRLSGAGRAAFFARQLDAPLNPERGNLHWTWRVPQTPAGASATSAATDDASLRIFVVFERHSTFARTPRALFYTVGDGAPRPRGATHRAMHSINAGRPQDAQDWVDVRADPAGDYRRVWKADPPPIVAVGVMQDTDQTGSAAIGDLRRLEWREDNASCP